MWTTLVCSRKIENKKSNRQPGFRGPLSVAGDGIRHIYLNLFYIIQIYMSSGLVLYTLMPTYGAKALFLFEENTNVGKHIFHRP